jgi:hypothetical protein
VRFWQKLAREALPVDWAAALSVIIGIVIAVWFLAVALTGCQQVTIQTGKDDSADKGLIKVAPVIDRKEK